MCCYNKIHDRNNVKEEVLALDHGFRGLSPLWLKGNSKAVHVSAGEGAEKQVLCFSVELPFFSPFYIFLDLQSRL